MSVLNRKVSQLYIPATYSLLLCKYCMVYTLYKLQLLFLFFKLLDWFSVRETAVTLQVHLYWMFGKMPAENPLTHTYNFGMPQTYNSHPLTHHHPPTHLQPPSLLCPSHDVVRQTTCVQAGLFCLSIPKLFAPFKTSQHTKTMSFAKKANIIVALALKEAYPLTLCTLRVRSWWVSGSGINLAPKAC